MSLLRTAQSLEPRVLAIALCAVVAIAGLVCYLYVIKKPLKNYVELKNQLEQLIPLAQANASNTDQQLALEQELAGLEQSAATNGSPMSSLIQTLDRLARQHTVKLATVAPLPSQDLGGATEFSYEVSASGGYGAVKHWLGELKTALAPGLVRHLALESMPESASIKARLIISIYERGGGA